MTQGSLFQFPLPFLKATIIELSSQHDTSTYSIKIICDIQSWEVTRTQEEFVCLDKDLQGSEGSCVPVLKLETNRIDALEVYINHLLELFSADQLTSFFFQRFIDNADHTSEMTKIRLSLIRNHVKILSEQSLVHESIVKQMDAKYSHLSVALNSMMDTAKIKEALLTEQSLQTDTFDYSIDYDSASKSAVWSQPNSSGRKPSSFYLKPEIDIQNESLTRQGSSTSLLFADLDLSVTRVEVDDDEQFDSSDTADDHIDHDSTPRGSFSCMVEYSSANANNLSFTGLKTSPEVSKVVSKPGSKKTSPDSFRSSPQFDDYFTKWEDSDKNPVDAKPLKDCGELQFLPSSKHLSAELYPSASLCTSSVNKILALVQPNDVRIQHHASAVSMLKKETRVALNFHAFDTGLRRLRCFLPDDPVRLGVVCRRRKDMMEGGSGASWQSDLMDHLKLVAMIGSSDILNSHSSEVIAYLNALYSDETDRSVLANAAEHSLSDVKTMPESRHEVNCTVDSMLHVAINAHTRADLCMLAFLEEFSSLVGQDNLFKRSLLLIRAWWVYEAASYVGCPIKHYLSDFSLCIMVCAIFNQYHAQIGSPLQALCLFLTEYSGYDGSTHAITLQGLARFRSNGSLTVPAVRAAHLADWSLMDKYEKLFSLGLNPAGGGSQQSPMRNAAEESFSLNQQQIIKTSSSEDTAVDDYSSGLLLNAASSDSINLMGDGPDSGEEDRQSVRFTRRATGIHVLHPFERVNMESESGVKPKQSGLLVKAIQTGAANLSLVLKSLVGLSEGGLEGETPLADDIIRNFFPTLFNRFGGPNAIKRHDKIRLNPNTAENISRDIWAVSTEPLWCNILYCNLVQEAVLSESALIMLSAEILSEQGPLVVGDIGKRLAQETKVAQLPQKLKERFGGLKEFLCHYPDHFVCAHDSDQNPHILLRKTLSAEDQLVLSASEVFPPELLAKLLKIKTEATAALLVSAGGHVPSTAKKVASHLEVRADQFQPHLARSSSPGSRFRLSSSMDSEPPASHGGGDFLNRISSSSPLLIARSPESSSSHSPIAVSVLPASSRLEEQSALEAGIATLSNKTPPSPVPAPKKKMNNPKRQPFQPHLQYLLQEGNKPVQIPATATRPLPSPQQQHPQLQQQQRFFPNQNEEFALYEEQQIAPHLQSYQNQLFRGPVAQQPPPPPPPPLRVTPPPYALQASPRQHMQQLAQQQQQMTPPQGSRGGPVDPRITQRAGPSHFDAGGGGFSPLYARSVSSDVHDDAGDDYYYQQQQQQAQQAQQRVQQRYQQPPPPQHPQHQNLHKPLFTAEDRYFASSEGGPAGALSGLMGGRGVRGGGSEGSFQQQQQDDELRFLQQRAHHQQQQPHHQTQQRFEQQSISQHRPPQQQMQQLQQQPSHYSSSSSRQQSDMDEALGEYFPSHHQQQSLSSASPRGGHLGSGFY